MAAWQPSATREVLETRARMLEDIRAFFRQQDVLEVSTPILSRAGNTDPNIDSVAANSAFSDQTFYLHTSPELPMKRLLSAGVGDCFQICQVFRDGEAGRNHNPEFTMLEWYRLGFDMPALINEVERLIKAVVTEQITATCRITFEDVIQQYLGVSPFDLSAEELNQILIREDLWTAEQELLDWDAALDLLFSLRIAPQFSSDCLTTIYHYPASQASLARLSETDPRVAERFEVYWGKLELANGFHELADANEQAMRFESDNAKRQQQGKPLMPIDQRFLEALENNFPDCSGVALGIDRLLMKIMQKKQIQDVVSFDWSRI